MTIVHMDDRRDCVLLGPLGVRQKPNFSVVVTDKVVTKTSGSLLQEVDAYTLTESFACTDHPGSLETVCEKDAATKCDESTFLL